jgi:hypothetical protein
LMWPTLPDIHIMQSPFSFNKAITALLLPLSER